MLCSRSLLVIYFKYNTVHMFFFNSFHYMGFREHQRIVYSLLTLSRTQVVAQTQKNLSDSAPGLLKYLGQPTLKLTHHFSFPLILGYAVYCWLQIFLLKKSKPRCSENPLSKTHHLLPRSLKLTLMCLLVLFFRTIFSLVSTQQPEWSFFFFQYKWKHIQNHPLASYCT